MKASDRYHVYVEWSDEDTIYIGYCPDLFLGGVCHGDNPVEVYAELREIVEEDIAERSAENKELPPVRIRPQAAVAA